MPDELTLEELDRDETIAEAVDGLKTTSRRGVLRRFGLIAGGGLVAGAVPLALAGAQSKGDVAILNYALTLEYLEAAFYNEALAKGNLKGSVLKFAQVVAAHENTHVTALKGALGSAAVKSPKFDFKNTTASSKTFLRTSKVLEDTGVSAYQGQATEIKDPGILATAGSILAVEARHAAWVRDLLADGKTPLPAPDAFSPAKTMDEILDAVKGTGFIVS